MSPPPQPASPMAGTVFRGALLMVLLRFVVRGLGLISLSVTARVLTPTDFGVVGSASIVIGLFAVLQNNGIFDWIVRKPSLAPEDIPRAWTANLLFNTVVAAGIAAAAVPASAFLNEPALAAVLPISALIPLLGAAASPMPVLFLRDLRFGRDFRLRVIQKALDVACVIAFCLVLRSYWGVIYGSVTSRVIFLIYTYLAFPFRPRLLLSNAGALLGFSLWVVVQSLATYLALFSDEVIVRRTSPTDVFGLYHVSRDLSRVLVSELVAPAATALLPGLARLQVDRLRFRAAARQAVGAGVIIATACGLGLSATAPEVVALLLGRQWAGAHPYLAYLAIGVAAQTMAGLHRSILLAMGRPAWSALLWLIRAAALFAACSVAISQGGALTVAVTFAVASVLLTVSDYVLIFGRLGQPTAILRLLVRPVIAGLAMTAVLALLPFPEAPPAVLALVKAGVGAVVYGSVLGLSWWIAGRPQGPETALLYRLPGPVARLLVRGTPAARPSP